MINIIKYEFNEYLEVELNGIEIRLNVVDISPFLSNEMTNHLTKVEEEHLLWLENYINNK